MRGHLRKRGSRKWQLVYDVPRGSDGRRKQRYETVDGTKKEAESRLTEILRSLDRGRYFEPTSMSVSEYLDLWLRDYAEPSVRPRTLQGYRGIVESGIKPAIGETRLVDLTASDVQRYYAKMTKSGLSAQTVTHHHRVLRQALKQAMRWDLIARNVTDGVTPPKRTKPKFKILTRAESERLLNAAEETAYHLPIHLALSAGLRRSEIIGLQWSDFDSGKSTLTVARATVGLTGDPMHTDDPKSNRSRRTVSIGEATRSMLESHRERREAELAQHGVLMTRFTQLCVRPDGSPMKPYALGAGYKRLALGCGIDGVRFHDLRHAHATMLLESGVPLHVVQARLGHESIQTTVDTYGHVLRSSDEAAGAAAERAFFN